MVAFSVLVQSEMRHICHRNISYIFASEELTSFSLVSHLNNEMIVWQKVLFLGTWGLKPNAIPNMIIPMHYGFCPLVKFTFKDLAKWLLWLTFPKLRVILYEIFGVPCSFSFTFFHIFHCSLPFSWVLIISDKLQFEGTSWMLPSKSGFKYLFEKHYDKKYLEDICT